MIAKISVSACLCLCLNQVGLAKEVEYSKGYSVCMDRSNGVTIEMVDCITAETKRQDQRMTIAYKKLMSSLNPARKNQLLAAQRLWIKYRDANCAFVYDPDGGSMARISGNGCYLDATTTRAQELEDFLE